MRRSLICPRGAISLFALAAVLSLSSMMVTAVFGQLLEPEGLMIYTGDPVERTGLKIGSWGSGKAEESSQTTFIGTRSLKITSRGLHDGGRLDLSTPLDIGVYFNDPVGYLQLIARFRAVEESSYGAYGGYSGAYGSSSSVTRGRPVRRVRVAMTVNGKALEGQVPLTACKMGEDGWLRISMPLAVIKAKQDITEPKIERLVITGDGTEPFYIGEIKLISDNKPIQVYPGEDQFVAARDEVMFKASAEPGAAAVRYSWDFDSSDGIQEDAAGEVVYHQYRKPGEYTATLTVSDIFGLKKPVTSTVEVTVYE